MEQKPHRQTLTRTTLGKSKKKSQKRVQRDECVIPPRVADEVLNRFTLGRNEKEATRISEYVEWQCAKDKEKVAYLEKVLTEHILGVRHDCWNVRTGKQRYWVITNPTNLYSQELFPSADYTLSFHLGLMLRMESTRKGAKDERTGDRLAAAFRRWEQAAEMLDRAEESEEVQAVGMRCRECLVAFVRSVATPSMVPTDKVEPKAGDFIHWSELIADTIARGESAAEIRSYLKAVARSTWQLASWLTHAANSVRYDGTVAVDATYAVLNAFGAALLRYERPVTDRCTRCGSLRLQIADSPDSATGSPVRCESCGFLDAVQSQETISKSSMKSRPRVARRRHGR